MFHRLTSLALIPLLSLAIACQKKDATKSGPAVAKGSGIVITTEEFKARLDEQSPFMRARYSTLEKKKEFLDNLIRFELLSREAEKAGLDRDPEVQKTLRRIMVQKLVQSRFQKPDSENDVPEADLKQYYDSHEKEFVRVKRIGLSQVFFKADAGSRAKKLALAKSTLAKIKAEEAKKTPGAFANIAREVSEDDATKARGGDLGGMKTQEDLEKQFSKEIADKLFALKSGDLTDPIESPTGLHLFRVNNVIDGSVTTFDTAKRQIAMRLSRERKSKEFDEWVKKLRDEAAITVDDAELEKIPVPAAPATPPGATRPAPGLSPGGATPGPVPAPAAPRAAPAKPTPAPPAAPAPK
jgi:peptidyl-prolyl cis-trans isomerase C